MNLKTFIQTFLVIFVTAPCLSQEINVNFHTVAVNIPGRPGPWLKHKGNNYCYYEMDDDKFSARADHHFYSIDDSGNINAQIEVPRELRVTYYDLYVKNDTIFTTEYYNHNTYYLDTKNDTWVKTKKGIDLYYEDKDYWVYSLSFGEWGGVTWFKNKQTKKQYEIGLTTPVVNKLNGAYYLSEGERIVKIEDPAKLDVSKEPYEYKKAVLDKNYRRFNNTASNGAEVLFEHEREDYFNPKFSIATSFVAHKKLYHLYSDSISTKIGVIKNGDLEPVYEFETNIHTFRKHYDSRNRIQNNHYQTLQFRTGDDETYGLIEIDEGDVNVTYFENTYQEPIFGEETLKEWFEKTFDFYYSNFNDLKLDQTDKVELDANATNLAQGHKVSHYLLDGRDAEGPKVYRKIESSELRLASLYYYTAEAKEVELIWFEWGKNNHKLRGMDDFVALLAKSSEMEKLYKLKFDWISKFLHDRLGTPSSVKTKEDEAQQKWEKGNIIVRLSYDKLSVDFTMHKK